MKVLLSKRSIIIASVAVLIALVTIISVNAFNSAGPVTGVANVVTRPIRGLATGVARTFGDIFAAIYRYQELERRNDELSSEIARLQLAAADAIALAEENDRFRALLDFRERHPGYAHEPAIITGWSSDNFTHSFTINRGYMNSDVRRDMGVATEYGVLIGQVSYVGATTSVVRTVLDTTFAAAVVVGGYTADDSDGTATARGDFAQMRNGLLVLDHMDDDLTIITGSNVVTSGHGGVFPPGLTIGTVVSISPHASGIGRFAIVRPVRDIEAILNVFVIIDFAVDDPTVEFPMAEIPEAEIPEVEPDD